MLTKEQITDFWNKLIDKEVVHDCEILLNDNVEQIIRIGMNHYSRKDAESVWELMPDNYKSPFEGVLQPT